MIEYGKKLVSMVLIIGGVALILEHLFTYGGFDVEIIGHEFYGMLMIVAGFLLALKWEQVKGLKRAVRERNMLGIFDRSRRKKNPEYDRDKREK